MRSAGSSPCIDNEPEEEPMRCVRHLAQVVGIQGGMWHDPGLQSFVVGRGRLDKQMDTGQGRATGTGRQEPGTSIPGSALCPLLNVKKVDFKSKPPSELSSSAALEFCVIKKAQSCILPFSMGDTHQTS